jgi:hypothetical protein
MEGPGIFIHKTLFIILFFILHGYPSPVYTLTIEMKEKRNLDRVQQERGKGERRGVPGIPVCPVIRVVVPYSLHRGGGVRTDPGTCQCWGVFMIVGTPSTELVSKSP